MIGPDGTSWLGGGKGVVKNTSERISREPVVGAAGLNFVDRGPIKTEKKNTKNFQKKFRKNRIRDIRYYYYYTSAIYYRVYYYGGKTRCYDDDDDDDDVEVASFLSYQPPLHPKDALCVTARHVIIIITARTVVERIRRAHIIIIVMYTLTAPKYYYY